MGIVIALLGTLLIWLLRINDSTGPIWPSALATIGFWALGALLTAVRRRSRR